MAEASAQPVAVVTGASSGIGREIAVALAAKGYHVVLAARREDKLSQTADLCRREHARHFAGREDAASVIAHPADVSVREQVEDLVDSTVRRLGRLDVMVNNAGSGLFGRVHELDESAVRRLFDVNFYGALYGCQAAARAMIPRRSGHIFNVSSVIGRRGTPFHGAYCATKFALCGLTDSLRVEMMPYRIRVTSVLPTLTDTEFFAHSAGRRRPLSEFQKRYGMMSARVVARRIAAAAGRDVPELVFSAGGKLLVVLAVLWPGLVDRMMKLYHDDLARKL
ncbi:MAG: putative oxidoreductase [Planctomycetes bacterium ADurb.Bin126]|nr:MAG: putative oxidoreductase [Planctomycetes bacterium ADurb.Bin126]HQL75746.1 SDR family oxidoreductase [Phycisphaerae bacterium]